MPLAWDTPEQSCKALLALGLALVRVKTGDNGTKGLDKRWTTAPPLSPDEALAWVTENDGNLGVRCGYRVPAETRVIVIDLDVGHAPGVDGIANAKSEALGLVPTWMLRTPRGGVHCYYQAPKDVRVKSLNGKLAKGVDVRAEGAMAVTAGSRRPDGVYAWVKGYAPGERELAPLPDQLRETMAKRGLIEPWPEPTEPVIEEEPVELSTVFAPGNDEEPLPIHPEAPDPCIDVPGVEKGERDTTCAAIAGRLIALEIPHERALPGLVAWGKRCNPPLSKTAVTKTWASILRGDKERHPDRHDTSRSRLGWTDNLGAMLDHIEARLLATHPPGSQWCIYRHSGGLAYATPAGVEVVTIGHLRERVANAVQLKFPGRDKQLPPTTVLQALADRPPGLSTLPILDAVLTFPKILAGPDGQPIISAAGYDAATKIVGAFDPASFEEIRPASTPQEARVLADSVLEPFAEFPWHAQADRTAFLALLLTLVMRPAVRGPVPMWAFRANAPGVGKTLLAQAAHALVMGDELALHPPTEGEEWRKILLATARSGASMLVVDNATGIFGDAEISQAITAGKLSGRILGASQLLSLPWRCLMVVTGNQLTFRRDLARRLMLCDLRCDMERPEARSFELDDLLGHLSANRPRLLGSLLALAVGFARSRVEIDLEPYGGFEGWSRTARLAATWATSIDPCENRGRLQDDDSDLESLRDVLRVWWQDIGGQPMLAGDIAYHAKQPLRQALLGMMTPRSRRWSSQAIGLALTGIAGRVSLGLKIHRRPTSRGNEWTCVQCPSDGPPPTPRRRSAKHREAADAPAAGVEVHGD